MRVLHLAAGNLYGGVETLMVTLARYREHGKPMAPEYALCFPGRLKEELEAEGVPVHDRGPTRFRDPWSIWRARTRLAEILRSREYDVIVSHSSWSHALFAPLARRSGCQLIFWAHGQTTGRHWLERLARRKFPDRIIANSRFTASTLHTLFPGVPTEVSNLPVPVPATLDRETIRREVRAELETDPSAIVLVTACRLEPWKGHTLLLDALQRLTNSVPWTCWIAGGPQRPSEERYLEELKARAHRSGLHERVRFLGQRRDVSRLLAAADIHCQPNTGPEPFGIAFIEALYAGLPVVTTAIGGALEIVDETCGMLVKPGEAAELATILTRLIDDASLRHHLGSNGSARARPLRPPGPDPSSVPSDPERPAGRGRRMTSLPSRGT